MVMSIPSDVRNFLDHYPYVDDDPTCSVNLQFYSNTIRCQPDNRTIDEIHEEWFGDYDKLEHKHGYIQWLFPIREHGMNYESQPLQRHEIAAMKANPIVVERIIRSYKLMLDFYGMRLVSVETGLVDRCLPPRYFKPRYRNLVCGSYLQAATLPLPYTFTFLDAYHNYLRISRIMKCLSELGLERLNAGFLLHVLNEQSENEELNTRSIHVSMDRWWANCIRNEKERERIGNLIRRVRTAEDDYVFTRQDYENALMHRAQPSG